MLTSLPLDNVAPLARDVQPALIGRKGLTTIHSVPAPAVLHNAVVLYRSTITFSYTVSTNHKSRLHIPTVTATFLVDPRRTGTFRVESQLEINLKPMALKALYFQ